jgi:hypothetical protein
MKERRRELQDNIRKLTEVAGPWFWLMCSNLTV